MSVRVPKYRFHKASGQAIVEIAGRHFYLGKFDSPELDFRTFLKFERARETR